MMNMIPHPGHPVHAGHPGYFVPVIKSVLQGRVYHRFGIFIFFLTKRLSIGLKKAFIINRLERPTNRPLIDIKLASKRDFFMK